MAVVLRLETDQPRLRERPVPPRRGPAEIVILPCVRREPLVTAPASPS